MTTEATPRLLSNLRGKRYGEVLMAFVDDGIRLEVYNSFPMNDCPEEQWTKLTHEGIAEEFGAAVVILNGPRYWLMDGIGKVDPVEPILRNFGGIDMRRVATLELEGNMERQFYTERHVNRGAIWLFDAGKKVHELLSPDGKVYVMQAYCTGVDPAMSEETLETLGERLALPAGWTYRTRSLDHELEIDTTESFATVIQDEFENTYSLVS